MLLLASVALALVQSSPTDGLSGGPHPGNRVWTVDSNGFGDFEEIQPAINAASNGDTLLIRYSPDVCCYEGFLIAGKSLTLLGTGTGARRVASGWVRNINGTGTVVISNLDFNWRGSGDVGGSTAALRATNCSGTLRFENCRVQGFGNDSSYSDVAGNAVRLGGCQNVVFQSCTFVGGDSGFYAPPNAVGGHGLITGGSNVVVYDSFIIGGLGGTMYIGYGNFEGFDGGHGVALNSGTLYISDSVVAGGEAGDGFDGDGGHGVRVNDGATAVARNTDLIGGRADYGVDGSPSTGNLLSVSPGICTLEAPTHLPEGVPLKVRVHAQPGEQVTVRVSNDSPSTYFGADAGHIHTGAPVHGGVIELGAVPASGSIAYDVSPPFVDSRGSERRFLQATITSPDGAVRLTDVHAVEWLDTDLYRDNAVPIFVDRNALPGGDGTSWETAYLNLIEGLAVVADCVPGSPVDVWVAQGVYTPDEAGGELMSSFDLRSGTRLLGGFQGTETQADQRRPDLYPVVLSGDLNRDDADGGGSDDNVYRVAKCGWFGYQDYALEENVLIDGLTIEGAGNSGGSFNPRGGGLALAGQATLRNVVIANNNARYGGGIYIYAGNLQMINCRVFGNTASTRGGGIYAYDDFRPRSGAPGQDPVQLSLIQCVVAENQAFQGGGLASSRITPNPSTKITVQNSTFVNNRATQFAGIYSIGSDTTITNSILWGNRSEQVTGQDEQLKGGSSTTILANYNCIEGLDGSLGGLGNIEREPTFVFLPPAGGTDDPASFDLRLVLGSAGIDAGNNLLVPSDVADIDDDGDTMERLPLDLSGLPRFLRGKPSVPGEREQPRVDMGAFESGPVRPRAAQQ